MFPLESQFILLEKMVGRFKAGGDDDDDDDQVEETILPTDIS